MWWSSSDSSQYAALETSCWDSNAEGTKLETFVDQPRLRRQDFLLRIAPWIGHSVFFLLSSALLIRASQLYERSQRLPGPPAAHELGSQSSLTLDGKFFAPSIYRGAPSPELDAAWEGLYNTGAIAISKADMLRIHKLDPSSVELSDEPGESYQAGLEVFHQIHCLDVIRKYTYFEYYAAAEQDFDRPMTRIHIDHCIEMLRQSLMCNSDLHVYTYNWVDRVDHAWPDFSTTKMCRNFEDIRKWGVQHQAHTSAAEGMLRRPVNASMLHVPSDEEVGL